MNSYNDKHYETYKIIEIFPALQFFAASLDLLDYVVPKDVPLQEPAGRNYTQ